MANGESAAGFGTLSEALQPVLFGEPELGGGLIAGVGCVIGYPRESFLQDVGPPTIDMKDPALPTTSVGSQVQLGNYVVIHDGTMIGDRCVLEDRVRIGYAGRVGDDTRLMYGAFVCDRVIVGNRARVAGFVCDAATIGDDCTVMGSLIHEYTRPDADWWDGDESPPTVEASSVVGMNAIVVGGVTVGHHCYVAAGAMVTKDVPPFSVVTGQNAIHSMRDWKGAKLRPLIERWLSSA